MEDSITPAELKAALDKGEKLVLVDVREDGEFAFTHIPGSKHVPLSSFASGYSKLDPAAACVTICHHGVRSMRALGFLKQNGFANVRSLTGGLDAYTAVDSTIKPY